MEPLDRRSAYDFNAALTAKVHDCIDLALALSAGVDHLLEDFVALQEALVLLVPDEQFNEVFQSTGLTDLRVLLATVAGRVEVVTDSPGLQMTAAEARALRARLAAGEPAVDDDSTERAEGAPAALSIVTLREKVARARQSAADRTTPPDE